MKYIYNEREKGFIYKSNSILSKATLLSFTDSSSLDANGNPRYIKKSIICLPPLENFQRIKHLLLYYFCLSIDEDRYKLDNTNKFYLKSLSLCSLKSRSSFMVIYIISLLISMSCMSTNHSIFTDFWSLGSACKMFQNLIVMESIEMNYFDIVGRLHILVTKIWNAIVPHFNSEYTKENLRGIYIRVFTIIDSITDNWTVKRIEDGKEYQSQAFDLSSIYKEILPYFVDIMNSDSINEYFESITKKHTMSIGTRKVGRIKEVINTFKLIANITDNSIEHDNIINFVKSCVWSGNLEDRIEYHGKQKNNVHRSCIIDYFIDNGIIKTENLKKLSAYCLDDKSWIFDDETFEFIMRAFIGTLFEKIEIISESIAKAKYNMIEIKKEKVRLQEALSKRFVGKALALDWNNEEIDDI
jgi:hypothetical protein